MKENNGNKGSLMKVIMVSKYIQVGYSIVCSPQISQQSTTIQLSSHTGNTKNTHPSPEHIDEVLFLL